MKFNKVSSAIFAASIFGIIVAEQRYECDGVTFSMEYILRTANAVKTYPFHSVNHFPRKHVRASQGRGRENYIEFPLLPSEDIWRGEAFDHYVLMSPQFDIFNVYSYLKDHYECDFKYD
ncbi:Bgt-50246 [Blumeria graminis f. sp. tritici]|uniref:Bgt-50246 n=1 Tax=Blumeria graminis f. sp. tritici TaxID=62690 RepID=A0A9X9MQV6_BLUGR|nr:Bgt-50246 [Blumeria graminis f. sp. tritici]